LASTLKNKKFTNHGDIQIINPLPPLKTCPVPGKTTAAVALMRLRMSGNEPTAWASELAGTNPYGSRWAEHVRGEAASHVYKVRQVQSEAAQILVHLPFQDGVEA
jgi:hypothetical protein